MSTMQVQVVMVVMRILCKLLLIPSYHSTDFEVHRNWLAITHSVPIHLWYQQASPSIWTLDYPPYFAYFEFLLSQFAVRVDPKMIQVDALNYASHACVYFQRISVILMDTLFQYFSAAYLNSHPYALHIFCLLLFNPCLLIIDHIHFQYNGFLIGILIACFYFAKFEKYVYLTHSFCVLILLKHLFLPLVPLFAIYLLRQYCRLSITSSHIHFNIQRFLILVLIACCHLLLAFGPFMLQSNPAEQLTAILTRLFPFERGLTHAYWAPNVWAIYSFVDYFGHIFYHKLFKIPYKAPGYVSGLVGNHSFTWLPNISPMTSLILVIIAIIPALIKIYHSPTSINLIKGTFHTTFSAFMLGYHVHEKAILVPLICSVLISFESRKSCEMMLHMMIPAIFSVFPLLIQPAEIMTKLSLSISYLVLQRMLPRDKLTLSHLRCFHSLIVAFLNQIWFVDGRICNWFCALGHSFFMRLFIPCCFMIPAYYH